MGKRSPSLNSTECPGEIVVWDAAGRVVSRTPCGNIITFWTTMCRRCKTLFAHGALAGFRVPAHASSKGAKREWITRFLKG